MAIQYLKDAKLAAERYKKANQVPKKKKDGKRVDRTFNIGGNDETV